MSKKSKSYYLSIQNILVLSLAITIVFHVIFSVALFFGKILYLSAPSSMADAPARKFNIWFFILFFVRTYLLVFIIFLFNRGMVNRYFKNKWGEVLASIFGSLALTIIYTMLWILPQFLQNYDNQVELGKMFHFVRDEFIRNILLMLLVDLVVQMIKLTTDKRNTAVENEALKTENMRSRLESLRNQMDPHFMFNSLNILQSLISINPSLAESYLQKMSCVLRYSLQGKEVVNLEEELQYLYSYCDMMQMRFGDNISFTIDIDDEARQCLMLPLTLQGLVENAIKHNVISNKKPLMITIKSIDGVVRVSNNVQPKIEKSKSSGIGLANLMERYRLMWGSEIVVENHDNETFTVSIPLINEQK